MTEVNILDSVEFEGEDVLFTARAEVKKFKMLNCKVPQMQVRGTWLMNGFTFDFGEEWYDAYPPLGNKYVKAGPKKAQVEPTSESEMRIYFVHTGESITDKNPLATGDLFAEEDYEVTAEDPAEPEPTE